MCSVMADSLRLRVKQWQLLRQLTGGARAVGEIAEALGRQPGPVTKALRTLEGLGLVEVTDVAGHSAPGQPRGRWGLTDAGRDLAEQEAAPPIDEPDQGAEPSESDDVGSSWPVVAHQTFLEARVQSGEVPALLDVLASRQHALEASFVARLDGEGQRYIFVFDKRLGGRPTEVLAAVLAAAGLPFSVGTVADVRRLDGFLRDARAAASAAITVREGGSAET